MEQLREGPPQPYVVAAFLCERVLIEVDGSLSAIRLADRFTVGVPLDAPMPSRDTPVPINPTFVLVLRGEQLATYTARAVLVAPDGRETQAFPPTPMTVQSPDQGANIAAVLFILVGLEGQYWLRLYIDDREITRVPLLVVFDRRDLGPADTPAPVPHE